MDQDFHICRSCDTDCMFCICYRRDLAVKRSHDNAFFRVDSDTVTENACCKRIIRDLISRNNGSLDRCIQFLCCTVYRYFFCCLFCCCRSVICFCCCHFGIFRVFFPGEPGQCECYCEGNCQHDRILCGIIQCGKESRDSCNSVRSCSNVENGSKQGSNGTTCHTTYKRFHETKVYTEDRRFCNSKCCR